MAKVEIEVPQIDAEQVVAEMASRLLGEVTEYGPDGEPIEESTWHRKKIGERLRAYLDERVDSMFTLLIRERFDNVIDAKVTEAVDAVLAAGWSETNRYGEATGRARTGGRADA